MGKIRNSSDPHFQFPSSIFGFADLPETANILLDDLCSVAVIKKFNAGGEFFNVDVVPYDFFEGYK